MPSAVIFVPYGQGKLRYGSQCLTYCSVRGYDVVGVVVGDWSAVVDVVIRGRAGVVVVARVQHLDPNREPRVEVAILDPRPRDVATARDRRRAGQRRPRRLT